MATLPRVHAQLLRFRVQPGRSELADEWIGFLRANPTAVRETLEPEQMYVESIFRETRDGVDYLYWYCLLGTDGAPTQESQHWLDVKHLQYWDACIDHEYGREVITQQLTTIPERVQDAMRPLNTSGGQSGR